jgi:Skp family chaperone for outer membrane proteins
MMRKAVLVGMVGCFLGLSSLVSAAEVKIGYVNLQRVKETDEWRRLEDLFTAEVSKSQLEVEQKKKELEGAALQYQRQKSMLSEDVQRAKERELQKKRLELQLWAQDRQQALEKKRSEMAQQIWSRIRDVVEKIAKEKRLTLVIDYEPNPPTAAFNFEKGFVYIAPGTDITDEVIEAFNAMFKGGT